MKVQLKQNRDGKMRVAKLPAKLGDCVDLLYTLQLERRETAKVLEGMKSAEDDLEKQLIVLFGKKKLEGAEGRKGKVALHPRSVPQVKDWKKFRAFLMKKKAWELMQRRISTEAVNEYVEGGVKPETMGIAFFKFTAVSCTKK